jgi:hypothetical protein
MSKILIDEATVKLALEALEPVSTFGRVGSRDIDTAKAQEAITAIKQALEQPVQSGLDADCIASVVSQRYTTPPAAQRQWVGLTDEETDTEATQHEQSHGFIQGVQWANTKLKELNA